MAATNGEKVTQFTVLECCAHLNYLCMLSITIKDSSMVDSGANTHVLGKSFRFLSPLSDPMFQLANVTGFDDQGTKKCGLPVGEAMGMAMKSIMDLLSSMQNTWFGTQQVLTL